MNRLVLEKGCETSGHPLPWGAVLVLKVSMVRNAGISSPAPSQLPLRPGACTKALFPVNSCRFQNDLQTVPQDPY